MFVEFAVLGVCREKFGVEVGVSVVGIAGALTSVQSSKLSLSSQVKSDLSLPPSIPLCRTSSYASPIPSSSPSLQSQQKSLPANCRMPARQAFELLSSNRNRKFSRS